jgi:hypothetical protein
MNYTKKHFIQTLEKEFAIITHLAQKLTPEELSYRPSMDAQKKLIIDTLEQFSEADFASTIALFGQPEKPKSVYLIEFILGWLYAYKMQLFLYMKAHGHPTLGTMNLWAGMDAPAPEAD